MKNRKKQDPDEETKVKLPRTRTEILTLRTAKITCWYPAHVRVQLYNDRTGQKEPTFHVEFVSETIEILNFLLQNPKESKQKTRRTLYNST